MGMQLISDLLSTCLCTLNRGTATTSTLTVSSSEYLGSCHGERNEKVLPPRLMVISISMISTFRKVSTFPGLRGSSSLTLRRNAFEGSTSWHWATNRRAQLYRYMTHSSFRKTKLQLTFTIVSRASRRFPADGRYGTSTCWYTCSANECLCQWSLYVHFLTESYR